MYDTYLEHHKNTQDFLLCFLISKGDLEVETDPVGDVTKQEV